MESRTINSLIDTAGTARALANTGGVTITGILDIDQYLKHTGDTDTLLEFSTNRIDLTAGNVTMLTLQETAQDIISVNVNNVDIDFRVGATGAANALFVQGSDGMVGLLTSAPSYPLDIRSDSGLAIGSDTGRRKYLTASTSSPFDILTIASIGKTGSWRGVINFDLSYNAGTVFTGASLRATTGGSNAFLGINTISPKGNLDAVSISALSAIYSSVNSATAAHVPIFAGFHNKGTTPGTYETTDDGFYLGSLAGHGVNANATPAITQGAAIRITQDGAAGATYLPGRINFITGTDSAAQTIRAYFDCNGDLYSSHNIYVANDKAVGISGGARFVFDATVTPDSITVTDADLWIGDGKDIGLGASAARLVFNDAATDNIQVLSANVAIGAVTPDCLLHVWAATAGSVTAQTNTLLALENNDNALLSILTPNNKYGLIAFGDPDDNDIGYIKYDHTTNVMSAKANAIGIELKPDALQIDYHYSGQITGNAGVPINTNTVSVPSNYRGIVVVYSDFNGGGASGQITRCYMLSGDGTMTQMANYDTAASYGSIGWSGGAYIVFSWTAASSSTVCNVKVHFISMAV